MPISKLYRVITDTETGQTHFVDDRVPKQGKEWELSSFVKEEDLPTNRIMNPVECILTTSKLCH